jgi:hypothetical protein
MLLGLRVRKLSTQMNVKLVVGQQFLDSRRMDRPANRHRASQGLAYSTG